MSTDTFIVRCGFGIGNRVAAMANGLSRYESIGFVWRVNWQCPAPWREVFPYGIPGVEIIDEAELAYATRWEGKPCDLWDAAGDRTKANEAYQTIIAAMAGEALPGMPFALCGRFTRITDPDLQSFAAAVAASAGNHRRVFMLADSRRSELAEALQRHGITAVYPGSRELDSNGKGRDAAQVIGYLSDWKTLCAADTIVCSPPSSSVVFPARARNAGITYI